MRFFLFSLSLLAALVVLTPESAAQHLPNVQHHTCTLPGNASGTCQTYTPPNAPSTPGFRCFEIRCEHPTRGTTHYGRRCAATSVTDQMLCDNAARSCYAACDGDFNRAGIHLPDGGDIFDGDNLSGGARMSPAPVTPRRQGAPKRGQQAPDPAGMDGFDLGNPGSLR